MSFKSSFKLLRRLEIPDWGLAFDLYLDMVFDIQVIQILAFYLDFEDAKNIHVL